MPTATAAAEKTEKQPMADEKPERKPQRARVDDKFKIFCGTANEPLCNEVCNFLGLTRGQAMVTRFADGEAYVQIQENVRGADVFVMQPTCHPVDMHLMELLLMLDALKRASARRITAVIPYYGYARLRLDETALILKIWIGRIAGMIHFGPVSLIVRLVGISGRTDG